MEPAPSDDETLTLGERIEALKDPAQCGRDFDAYSWAWLVLLGMVLPALLLLAGWNL